MGELIKILILVPADEWTPFVFLGQDESLLISFIVELWGGVLILNKKNSYTLNEDDYYRIASHSAAMLRMLFDFDEVPVHDQFELLPSSVNTFSEWEMDILKRRKITRDLNTTINTLNHLYDLIKRSPSDQYFPERIKFKVFFFFKKIII